METLDCKGCGRNISAHFDKCPHCKATVPLHSLNAVRYITISVAILLTVVVAAFLIGR